MKILNVNMAINSLHGGGTAERTYQMSKHLADRGIKCSILTLNLGLTPEILNSLDTVEVVTIPCMNKRFFVPQLSFKSLKRINDLIARVDIVHIMGHWSIINALVYIFARQLNKPYVFCPAGTYLIYGRSKNLKLLYNLIIGQKIMRNAKLCIASTAEERSYIVNCGVNSRKVVLIPNGIDLENIPVRNEVSFRSKYNIGDCPFILFVGTFSPIKGPDLLLEAFNRVKEKFPSYRLVFAGTDRGMLPELRKYVAKFNLQARVHFVGHLGEIDKAQAYYTADLLVVPSRSEVISMVALEAGSTGTPVLITDQCGFDEITAVDGGMVVPASVAGLERGLIELLSRPERLKAIGKNLEKYIAQNYSWGNITRKYIELYNQILL